VLFQQQIGRGLRLAPGKESCLVLDFVGQHRAEFRYDRLLSSLTGLSRRELVDSVENGFGSLPPGCHITCSARPLAEMAEKLEELKQSLLELDVELEVKLNPNIHDREIRLDNGWVVKIGRGLDFYQRPSGWFEVGAHDLNLRKCLETKVDIFRAG
jgi:hypothetical protein